MNKKRKIKFRSLFLMMFILCIVISIFKQRLLMKQLSSKRIELQSEVDVLEKDVKSLRKEIGISDSIEFTEKVAREELGMVKAREIIYIDKNKEKPNKKLKTTVND